MEDERNACAQMHLEQALEALEQPRGKQPALWQTVARTRTPSLTSRRSVSSQPSSTLTGGGGGGEGEGAVKAAVVKEKEEEEEEEEGTGASGWAVGRSHHGVGGWVARAPLTLGAPLHPPQGCVRVPSCEGESDRERAVRAREREWVIASADAASQSVRAATNESEREGV